MDRGFELMIPQPKEEEPKEPVFNYEIKFVLFKKEFNLRFRVK